MIQVGKHAWGTAKCGISLLKNIWENIAEPVDYEFLLARNPYDRLVSFYTEKIADVNGRYAKQQRLSTRDWVNRNDIMYKPISRFSPPLLLDLLEPKDISFKNFVMSLDRGWLSEQDEHINRQTLNVPKFGFDDIIWLHDLPECFEIPRDKLGIRLNCSKEHLIEQGGTDRGDSHATPKRESLNDMVNAGTVPASNWWALKSVPSDYSCFYDDETREQVFYLYHEDFAYFNLSK